MDRSIFIAGVNNIGGALSTFTDPIRRVFGRIPFELLLQWWSYTYWRYHGENDQVDSIASCSMAHAWDFVDNLSINTLQQPVTTYTSSLAGQLPKMRYKNSMCSSSHCVEMHVIFVSIFRWPMDRQEWWTRYMDKLWQNWNYVPTNIIVFIRRLIKLMSFNWY